jgi:hypothetical protein
VEERKKQKKNDMKTPKTEENAKVTSASSLAFPLRKEVFLALLSEKESNVNSSVHNEKWNVEAENKRICVMISEFHAIHSRRITSRGWD